MIVSEREIRLCIMEPTLEGGCTRALERCWYGMFCTLPASRGDSTREPTADDTHRFSIYLSK